MSSLLMTAVRRGAASMARRTFSHYGETIKVFGHKNPDTDATCGAIIRAFELQQHGACVHE